LCGGNQRIGDEVTARKALAIDGTSDRINIARDQFAIDWALRHFVFDFGDLASGTRGGPRKSLDFAGFWAGGPAASKQRPIRRSTPAA